jgi:hypothetical protein
MERDILPHLSFTTCARSMHDKSSKVSILSLSPLLTYLITIPVFHHWKLATPSKWAFSQPGCPFMDFRRERAQTKFARWWCEFTRITQALAFHRLFVDAGRALCNISTRGSDVPIPSRIMIRFADCMQVVRVVDADAHVCSAARPRDVGSRQSISGSSRHLSDTQGRRNPPRHSQG